MTDPQSPEPVMIERINITLNDVPESLHRAWKAMAALNGISMKDAVLTALRMWVSEEAKKLEGQQLIAP
jgi:hypothetical protein